MLVNNVLSKLLKEGNVLDHRLIEVDGLYTAIDQLDTVNMKGKLVRISKHLYHEGKLLTIGGPEWSDLGINNPSIKVDRPKQKK